MRAMLMGEDHEELGEVVSAACGDHVGLALTRGRFAKAYRYVDANEDAVAAVVGPRATLLVCADGHTGLVASHVAVRSLLDAIGEDPPEDLGDDEWLELFAAVDEAVRTAKATGSAHPASETVLLVALASPGRLSFAGIGDAALVVGRPGTARGRQLNRESMRFLGRPMSRRSLKGAVQRGRVALEDEEWVALVTDGLSEFVAPLRPADVVPRALALSGPGSAEEAALAIVDAACAAGAGDNVAAVVLAPPGRDGRIA